MKIAIFGSWRKYTNEGKKQDFQDACFKLGRIILQNNHDLNVCSFSENTADYYIIKGALDLSRELNLNEPRINVFRPYDNFGEFETLFLKYPNIFRKQEIKKRTWEEVHINSFDDADLIIIIGGNILSYEAGMASILANKKIIPVGSFGGAGKKLLKYLEKKLDTEFYNVLTGKWSNLIIEFILKRLTQDQQKSELSITINSAESAKIIEEINDRDLLKYIAFNVLEIRNIVSNFETLFTEVSKTSLTTILDKIDAQNFLNI